MKPLALLLLGAVWTLLPGPARSQGLAIAPIMVDAPARGGAASLTVSSTLEKNITVQVRVFDWTQPGGEDRLVPARALRFAPEIFTLSPGNSQVVRMSVPDTGGQGAWRIIIDEVPSGDAASATGAAQLSIRLRHVLAMFAGAPGAPGKLEARRSDEGLSLHNPGPGWLRLYGLTLEGEDVGARPTRAGIVYLLPGSELSLPSPEPAPFTALSYLVGGEAFSTPIQPGR